MTNSLKGTIIVLYKRKTRKKLTNQREKAMTTRELRQMLTEVEDQEMTVRELRGILFGIEDQDAEISPIDFMKLTRR